MGVIAVLTNLPDSASAFNLARSLVERRLAACVNVLAPATSFYRWEERLQQEQETPLIIKTTTEAYDQLERAIRELHPYELPEIIALPVIRGFDNYLGWVASECKPEPEAGTDK